jgi:hypothetical protein
MKHSYTIPFSFTIRIALLSVVLLLAGFTSYAQSVISGKILDDKNIPVRGASVYLDNTLDGGTTDSLGAFSFQTSEKGTQSLVASAIGYSTVGTPVEINGDVNGISLTLKNTAKTLEEVTITAGAFEASNDKDKTVLKPLDIVTTAGAQADVVRAIETLPGTQKQGTENGMFVRGGDASEAAFIVDGMVIQNAFFSGPPGVATRSRFGAFQYKGVSFSSGGYSARYGQALSSVLELNSLDLPEKSTVNLGVNMAGVYASGSKLWKKTGGDVTAYYNNLQPFYGIIKTNVDYYDVPKGGGGSARFAWEPRKNGIFKVSVAGSRFTSGVTVPDTNYNPISYGIENHNYTANMSYRQLLNSKFSIFAAAAASYNTDDILVDTIPSLQKEQREQLRLEGKYSFTSRLNLLAGIEVQHYDINKEFGMYKSNFIEDQLAGYLEAEWTPVYWLAFKPGVRYEYSRLLDRNAVAPRMAMALKAGAHGQFSLASGVFYQNPDYNYLYGVENGGVNLDFQRAVHYIVNYQWQHSDRTLRLETYYKDYSALVKGTYDAGANNNGGGYAKGAELFWRDKKTFKNTDYWISYSYIDTKREYKYYPTEATPEFISDHNLNVVAKYWIDKIETQINCTYSYASGRPYYNPLNAKFLDDRTPDYHNLSFTVNHLRSFGKWFTVIYAGVDNVTNQHNVFGYRYTSDGLKHPVRPALYRSYFVGVNFSLSKFDKDEL